MRVLNDPNRLVIASDQLLDLFTAECLFKRSRTTKRMECHVPVRPNSMLALA